MNKNEEFILSIEDMGKDGEGIGHLDGLTVFVKDTAVGDVIRAKCIKEKKNLAYARLLEVITPSSFRVEPVCAVAKSCGGCTLQHISYEKQLELKASYVENCLKRIGGVEDIRERMEPILGMAEPWHYRNKMQFPVGKDRDGNVVLGFFAGRTHSLVSLSDCPVGHPVNRSILGAVQEYLTSENIPVYDEEKHTGLVRHVVTRIGFSTGELMVCIVANGEKLPAADHLIHNLEQAAGKEGVSLASLCLNVNKEKTNRILGFRSKVLYGKDAIEDTIGDIRFRIAPESFFQVNPAQTEVLYGKALEFAGLTGSEVVWDMYCGIGSISLFLARRAKQVYGVEIIPQAVENAKENAARNSMENVEFFTGKAEEVVPRLYEESPELYRADVVVVDPPRKGCERELLSTILQMSPERIVYVSCDPSTLARDVHFLSEGGYALKKAVPVDMFGQSMHVEVATLLTRVSNRKADSYVKLNVKMEDYYRIKDAEGDETNE